MGEPLDLNGMPNKHHEEDQYFVEDICKTLGGHKGSDHDYGTCERCFTRRTVTGACSR